MEERRLKLYYMLHEQQRAEQLALATLQAGHLSLPPTSIQSTEEEQHRQQALKEATGVADGESKGQGLHRPTYGMLKEMLPEATDTQASQPTMC